ncbi:Ribose ABC transport system2C ATP-binding protein RbsA (TC 3.A.1.2.1), partial [Terribacillus sp. AE2B 122]
LKEQKPQISPIKGKLSWLWS